MAHNLDMTNGRANMAFLGSRQDIWHRLGEEMQPGMSIDAWATAAGLNWTAVKVPAIASLEGAQIAKGFANYKAMGDALAQNEMAKEEVSAFFKECLDIPFDAKSADISGRKRNQFDAVGKAYRISVREGAPAGSAWAALNAITRYVDHDRTNGTDEAVFSTAQFGSGAAIKAQAVELLMPRIADKILIPA